jgi:hypothetical protein
VTTSACIKYPPGSQAYSEWKIWFF